MSNIKLTWMADELRAAGLEVAEAKGWRTRTNNTSNTYQPVGVMNHHTAGSSVLPNYPDPPFWSWSSLWYKCNLTIEPTGRVVCLNAGYAYDSGKGVPWVLEQVVNDQPLPDMVGNPGKLKSTVNGNPYYIDIEVQHLGDGSAIAAVQLDALHRTNAVLCNHYRWNPETRVIGHYEWAPDRKVDPYWGGTKSTMPTIRTESVKALHQPTAKESESMLIIDNHDGTPAYYLLHFGRLTNITEADADSWEGPHLEVVDAAAWERIVAAYPAAVPKVDVDLHPSVTFPPMTLEGTITTQEETT